MSDPKYVEIAGKALSCQHCGEQRFHPKSATIEHPAFGGLFNLEGIWGYQATIYVCSNCGYLHWFVGTSSAQEQVAAEQVEPEPVDCLTCGFVIPAGAEACPSCGWSWNADEPKPG